jgi:hypothetical protein
MLEVADRRTLPQNFRVGSDDNDDNLGLPGEFDVLIGYAATSLGAALH